MYIFCKTLLGKSLTLDIENDITVKDLKDLIRSKLALPDEQNIILSRGDIAEIKDDDLLIVTKKENIEEPIPFFQTEGKQTHLSGAGFIIIVNPPKISHTQSDLFKPPVKEENISTDSNNIQPENRHTCAIS